MGRELWIAVVSAFIGALSSIAVASISYINRDRELDLEMVKISLSILSGDNRDSSAPGRRFALRALATYSGVTIPPDDFSTWVENGTVPQIPWLARNQNLAGLAAQMLGEACTSPDCTVEFTPRLIDPRTPQSERDGGRGK